MDFGFKLLIMNYLVTINYRFAQLLPQPPDLRLIPKGERPNEAELAPKRMTAIDKIKWRLKESGIFDTKDKELSERDSLQLSELWEAVELTISARDRQPLSAQRVFASLRAARHHFDSMRGSGKISDSLAQRFHWDRLYRGRGRPSTATTVDRLPRPRNVGKL